MQTCLFFHRHLLSLIRGMISWLNQAVLKYLERLQGFRTGELIITSHCLSMQTLRNFAFPCNLLWRCNIISILWNHFKDKIETTATRSIRAKTVGCISQKLATSYSSFDALIDIVKTSVLESFTSNYEISETIEWDGVLEGLPGKINGFAKKMVNLGIEKEVKLLKSDDWIFGKTPKFSLQLLDSHTDDLRRIYVENGRIKESTNSEFPAGKSFHKAFLLSRYSELFRSWPTAFSFSLFL